MDNHLLLALGTGGNLRSCFIFVFHCLIASFIIEPYPVPNVVFLTINVRTQNNASNVIMTFTNDISTQITNTYKK